MNKKDQNSYKRLPENFVNKIFEKKWSKNPETYFYNGITFVVRGIDDNLLIAYTYGDYTPSMRNSTFRKFLIEFVIICFTVILLIIPISNIFFKRFLEKLTEPIDELQNGVKRIKKGNLSKPINENYENEFRDVCVAFNDMQSHLKNEQEKNRKLEHKYIDFVTKITENMTSNKTNNLKESLTNKLNMDLSTKNKNEDFKKGNER